MFRYVENDQQTNGYFEAKAYVCERFYTYTVEEKYPITLHGVNIVTFRRDEGNWSRSTGGDKSTEQTISSIIEGGTTCRNSFTHNDLNSAHYVHHP